jgi:hypothetical protein
MNATINRPTGRLAVLLVCASALLTAMAEPASAHKIEFRPPVSHHYYYQHGRPFVFPPWLRKDREFQHWYVHSDYRYVRGADWRLLYDLYLYDTRRLKRGYKHFHGKVYSDLSRLPRRRHR